MSLKGIPKLRESIKYLQRVVEPICEVSESAAVQLLEKCIDLIEADFLVPVYREHQPQWISPCSLGNPCATCQLHSSCSNGSPCRGCRRGKAVKCERATLAPPAFKLPFKHAITLVKDGLAAFRHGNTCLQLTFSRLAHLRDASCKVDEAMLIAYAEMQPRARAAVDFGWGVAIPDVSRGEWTPEMVKASEETVRSFL